MKKLLSIVLKLGAGTIVGYALSHHTSHPNGRARKHVPFARVGKVQLTPNLLIATKNKTWHVHHWAYLPALYVPFITVLGGLARKYWLHGFMLGSVIHGLTFKDRFTFFRSSS